MITTICAPIIEALAANMKYLQHIGVVSLSLRGCREDVPIVNDESCNFFCRTQKIWSALVLPFMLQS